jgi:hypothetical protein
LKKLCLDSNGFTMKFITITACAALALAPPALAIQGPTTYSMVSDVISGGGQQVSGSTYTLTGTIGQSSAIGLSTGATYSNQGGFWNIRTGDTVAPTAPVFTLQNPARALAVPITALTSTDIGSGVTGYYINQTGTPPSDAWSSAWVPPTPASALAATKGAQTFYAWARDGAGNISAGTPASTSVIYQWLLSVGFGGTGGASITSYPGAIACMAGPTGTCSSLFDEGAPITLTGAPDFRSQLASWSGAGFTTSTSNPFTLALAADTTVTGTFATVSAAARIVWDKGYTSLPAAILALNASGKTVQARDIYSSGITTENLLFNQSYNVTLTGGMNATWDTMAGFTSIKGTLKVNSGKLAVQGIKVHP